MSEVYSIFLSAVFSSFIVTTCIITILVAVYYLTLKCFASYISFDKVAQDKKKAHHHKTLALVIDIT